MKKFLIIVLSSILVVFFSVSGIAYADASSAVYTQSIFMTKYGKSIDISYLQSEDECLDHADAINHTSAVKIANGSFKYNCYTYAMFFEGNIGGINQLDNNKIFCINVPDNLLKSPCYESVTFNNVIPGDVALYYVTTNMDHQEEGYRHSGIVYSKGNTLNNTVVESKWGKYAVYRHNIMDCPYVGLPSSQGGYFANLTISFARFTHDYSYRLIRKNSVATSYHLAECKDCGVYHAEAHDFINRNNYMVCKDCGYNTGIQVNNVEDTE